MSWKDEIIQSLVQRDNKRCDMDVFDSFSRVMEVVEQQREELALFSTSSVHQALREQTEKVFKLTAESSRFKGAAKELQRYRSLYADKTRRLEKLQEETQLKTKNFEVINDEILSLQIENNLLNDLNKKLKEENERLVKRWLDKVGRDAELLNEFNERNT